MNDDDQTTTTQADEWVSRTLFDIANREADQIAAGMFWGYMDAKGRHDAPHLAHLLPERLSVREVIAAVERIESGTNSTMVLDRDRMNLGRAFQARFDYARSLSQQTRPRFPSLLDCVWWLNQILEREISESLRSSIILAFQKCDSGIVPKVAVEQWNAAMAHGKAADRLEEFPLMQKRSWKVCMTDWFKWLRSFWKNAFTQIGE